MVFWELNYRHLAAGGQWEGHNASRGGVYIINPWKITVLRLKH